MGDEGVDDNNLYMALEGDLAGVQCETGLCLVPVCVRSSEGSQ